MTPSLRSVRTAAVAPGLACAVLAWTTAARADSTRPIGVDTWHAAAQDYFAAEDLSNAVYVGLGAAGIGAGTALIAASDTDELQAAGVPILAVGGIELVIGVVYLALTPAWKRDALAALASDPKSFQRGEVARVGAVEELFPYFKLVEGAALVAGIVIASVGAAEGDRTIAGVGAGLATAGTIQLTMEHVTHQVAKDYLRRIERPSWAPWIFPGGGGLAVVGRY